MPIIALIAVIALIVVIVGNLPSQRVGNARGSSPAPLPQGPAFNKPCAHTLAFISGGKLFYQVPGQELRATEPPYSGRDGPHRALATAARLEGRHGFRPIFHRSEPAQCRRRRAAAVSSAQFVAHDRVLYFLKDDSVGGLFEYDLTQGTEKRLLHKQNLSLEDLRSNPDGRQVLCAQQAKGGIANIVIMDADGNNCRELTGGDTVDAAPAWVQGQPDLVLFQSSGLARNPAGYVIACGPTSIQMADTAAGSLTVVLEDPRLDFLQPRVGPDGFLYFIRRPYEAPRYGAKNILTDTLMFPFRLLQAVVHYLNFFCLMDSRKPLITASGPAVQADLKEILVKGKRLDADAALRSGALLMAYRPWCRRRGSLCAAVRGDRSTCWRRTSRRSTSRPTVRSCSPRATACLPWMAAIRRRSC